MRITRRRRLALAVAIAGVAGGLAATWPASAAAPRAASAPTPVNLYFFHDGPDPIPGYPGTPIAAVALPKGSWVVTAKLMVALTGPLPAGITYPQFVTSCQMSLGSGPDADADSGFFSVPLDAAAPAAAGPVVMTASHTFTEAGVVTITCLAFTPSTSYQFLRIEAVKVASIVRTGL